MPHPLLDRLLAPKAAKPLRWRALGVMYLCAGALGLVTLIAGVEVQADVTALTALAAVALAAGTGLVVWAPRMPERFLGFAMAAGVVMTSAAVLAFGEADSPYSLFYVWIGVEAWFFLRARHAVAVTALCVGLSAVTMAFVPESDGDTLTWWLMTNGTLFALSGFAGVLYGRTVHLATHDDLTGLLNRRGFQQRIETELRRALRYEQPLSIVLGDLDSFKALNDRFGHRCGDDALRGFAAVCEEHVRGVDLVVRVGGEEFALVLPDTDEAGAVLVAERVRRAVRDRLRAPDGTAVTASFGVASWPKHGLDAEVLLDHADQAMYAAKRLGRDRTLCFGLDLPAAAEPLAEQEHVQAVVFLAETLDMRDAGTRAHSDTVARYSEQIAERLGLDGEVVERVRLAGLLHDIGKVGVSDAILGKPAALTDDEFAEMRKHSELGARILEGAGLHDVAHWVLAHHERPDGNGYPYGIAGDAIPLEARILAVADAYEAMTADRPYRDAMHRADAMAELEAGTGSQFDPDVVRVFSEVVGAGADARDESGLARMASPFEPR